ncbi:hypothetical protein Acr_09g0009180 [Actinidia rufa]|uniref:Protein FAR1-RELATED SEQUENCE n=1 Tax=Actinidia rufa TaxID=165716 RepID=A0A7J0F6X9_9ERIC|nr:hypothetical protein Acr_09g0009180 [Actinidia rufa]
MNLLIKQYEENGPLVVYKIGIYGKTHEHVVTFNSLDDTISCDCMKFEFVGILCCHVLKVLEHRDINFIPAKYILKRWTTDATVRNVRSCKKHSEGEDPKLATLSRYKDLCRHAINVSTMAAKTEEDYQFLKRHFQEAMLKLGKNSSDSTSSNLLANEKLNEDNINHIEVKGLKRKEGGVRRGSRIKSGLEAMGPSNHIGYSNDLAYTSMEFSASDVVEEQWYNASDVATRKSRESK